MPHPRYLRGSVSTSFDILYSPECGAGLCDGGHVRFVDVSHTPKILDQISLRESQKNSCDVKLLFRRKWLMPSWWIHEIRHRGSVANFSHAIEPKSRSYFLIYLDVWSLEEISVSNVIFYILYPKHGLVYFLMQFHWPQSLPIRTRG